jgi:hypothetical protein
MQRFLYERVHALYVVGFVLRSLGKTKGMKLCPVCLNEQTFLTIKCLHRLYHISLYRRIRQKFCSRQVISNIRMVLVTPYVKLYTGGAKKIVYT